jgi:hypothetical protein
MKVAFLFPFARVIYITLAQRDIRQDSKKMESHTRHRKTSAKSHYLNPPSLHTELSLIQ